MVIPVLKEKETSEVFDKRTNQQFEREKLLSRLTILRSALQYLQNGSPSVCFDELVEMVGVSILEATSSL